MSELQNPARLASVVYASPAGADDPAELYHEASKLAPSTAARETAGALRLAASEELQHATARASLRHPELPLVPLPRPAPLRMQLGRALGRRRSTRELAAGSLPRRTLSTLLHAADGIVAPDAEPPLRTAPSAGALYPLELYVAIADVAAIPAGVYRFDPFEHALERTGVAVAALPSATPYGDLVARAAATVVVTACFWRSRFKYGLRAYRFTLLEAGHVVQNLLLAATALGVGAVPLGGFYDGRVDALLGLDGVDHSSLYLVALGRSDRG